MGTKDSVAESGLGAGRSKSQYSSENKSWYGGKLLLIRITVIWGDGSIPPKTTSENSIMKALKGKRKVISIIEIEGQSRHHPPLSAG